MKPTFRKKAAFLAASSLLAIGATGAHATAVETDFAGYPTTIEIAQVSLDHHDEKAGATVTAKKLGLWAAAVASLGGILALVGPRKMFNAVSKGAGQAAGAAMKAGASAVKTVGRAASSPLRFAALIAGLSLFAMTGIGLYDIEWIGGMIAGASLIGVAAYSAMKTRKVLSPVRVKSRTPQSNQDQ